MLGKLSIIGAVAAIFMDAPQRCPPKSAALLTPAVPFASLVVRGVPGPDLGTWRSPSGERSFN